MKYLLTRTAKDGSTIGTSNEWTSLHSDIDSAIDKINNTANWYANVRFCAEGWRKTMNGYLPNGKVQTVYKYNGED